MEKKIVILFNTYTKSMFLKGYRFSKIFLLLALSGCLLFSCRKAEFQQPEEGSKIPFTDSVTTTLESVFLQDSHSLFYAVWKRSGIENEAYFDQGFNVSLTILLPDNAAMEKAGWNTSAIGQHTPTECKDFIRRHLILQAISPDELQEKVGNLIVDTKYNLPNTYYRNTDSPFPRSIALDWASDKFVLNGKPVENTKVNQVKEGFIYTIPTVLEVPQKNLWQILKSDPRFSMYTGLVEKTDSMYKAIFKAANGYNPEQGHVFAQLYVRDFPKMCGLEPYTVSDQKNIIYEVGTYFIPNNDAFIAAGFQTLDDLLDFNQQRGLPRANWIDPGYGFDPFYQLVGNFATDSLLNYHYGWGMDFSDQAYERNQHRFYFLANDLRDEVLSGYPIGKYVIYAVNSSNQLVRSEAKFYPMPFSFSANRISVSHLGVSANIVEKDLVGTNGVIHMLDKLLLPPGFLKN